MALPACVTSLIPTSGAAPNPTALLAQIPGCIQTVLATAALPVDVSQCVASVMATVAGVLNPATIGSLPNLDMSSCVPLDVTECTSSVLAVADMALVSDVLGQIFGSGLGGLGGLAGLGGLGLPIPGLDAIPAGCVPINIDECLTSLTGSLATIPTSGALPQVNLSACMPTGLTSGHPRPGRRHPRPERDPVPSPSAGSATSRRHQIGPHRAHEAPPRFTAGGGASPRPPSVVPSGPGGDHGQPDVVERPAGELRRHRLDQGFPLGLAGAGRGGCAAPRWRGTCGAPRPRRRGWAPRGARRRRR